MPVDETEFKTDGLHFFIALYMQINNFH